MLTIKPMGKSKKIADLPVIRSMEELKTISEKAYIGLKKRIETDKRKRGRG